MADERPETGDPSPILYASVVESSGYAHAALRNMDALSRAGAPPAWLPMLRSPRGYDLEADPARVRREIARLGLAEDDPQWANAWRRLGTPSSGRNFVLHSVPEQWPRLQRPGARNVGFTVWETDRLPQHWPAVLRSVDHVLVPDRHSQALVADVVGADRVSRIPHPVRVPREPGAEEVDDFRQRFGIERDVFVFYTITAWTPRKSPWLALHAYLLAFDADDPVVFVLKTGPMGVAGELADSTAPTHQLVRGIVSDYPHAARVCLVSHELPRRDIDCMHAVGDCYVSLVRGEGWGLGAFDAAAAGRPVIATGWGGHLDYLDPDDAWLVDCRFDPVRDARGGRSYSRDQQWATPDLDQAIDTMRHAFEHRDEALARGRRLRGRVTSEFAPATVGNDLQRVLGD